MKAIQPRQRSLVGTITGLSAFVSVFLGAAHAQSLSPAPATEPVRAEVTQAEAMRWALEHNPELAAIRQQHGIAAAGVVIAQTYPFNPILESKVRAVFGPSAVKIDNVVSNEHKIFIEVEIRGQGEHRRQAAAAALTRTDWEIANQETVLAIRVARAFDTTLYRRQKLHLLEENIRLNEQATAQVRRLVDQNKLRGADLIVVRSEVEDFRAQAAAARSSLVTAAHDLRRALGVVHEELALKGTLSAAVNGGEAEALPRLALERRADLRAREAALSEAEARLRLEVANRYGNPVVGPAYEYDPARVNLVGAQVVLPIPVCNVHRGEIRQRQAERDRFALEVQQVEIQIRQDVEAALARVKDALAWEETYRTRVLPELRKGVEGIEKLFAEGDPGVDLLRVLDVRRKLLKAHDGYLDALWEISQARADLAAAVGDPTLSTPLPSVPEKLP